MIYGTFHVWKTVNENLLTRFRRQLRLAADLVGIHVWPNARHVEES